MFQLVFWTIVVSALAGLITKFSLDRSDCPEEITWKEFAAGMAVIVLLLAPGVTKIGWELARSNMVRYEEYRNGWEAAAVRQDVVCTRDGQCGHTYSCDPYTVYYPCSCNCDSKGNCSVCICSRTEYHSCPYADMETNYYVKTTLEDFTIAACRFPADPQSRRWRKSEAIPQYVIDAAGAGEPPLWRAAKNRIDSKNPGPVSVRKEYDNYILASDQTILKQYSSEISRFSSAGLLPKLNSGIYDFYMADKVYFVGYRPKDAAAWQWSVGRLNAALGNEMQGDLHLVIVRNENISRNPDAYALALKAYWQNTKVFGRNAFSKNGIGVIVGTLDGETVAWSRAFTGMPLGNEELTVAIRGDLKGLPLTPESVVGEVRGELYAEGGALKVRGIHGKGALETDIWGLKDSSTRFRRFGMTGKSGAGSGFFYLRGEIEPAPYQKFLIFFCAFLTSSISWVVFAFVGERTYKRNWRSSRPNPQKGGRL